MSTTGETTPWKKATASDSNNCVEARLNNGVPELRDSKDPNGPVLQFTGPEIAAMIDGVKRGEFDYLVQDL